MLILAIDTSGKTASVAAAQAEDGNQVLLGQRMLYTARAHSQILLPMAKALLTETGHTVSDVDLFAVANGPGSYTGLRIGIAAVQAMAFAGGKPCTGISTLEGLAWNLCAVRGVICAAMCARQNLLYAAFFESDGRIVRRLTEDTVIAAEDCAAQLEAYGQPVTVAGDGFALLKEHTAQGIAAPMHLGLQSAAGICMAALHTEAALPEALTVRYLQEVKIG